jgi:APA family basic amino acid/polyamine antiporter
MIDSERPGFGPATAAFVVVSSMVGTGVLTTSGYAVLGVKSNAIVLALWVVGGLIALAGALTLAELSAMLPKSGGEYVILREAYGPPAAFLAGWVSLLLGFAAPIAATASAAAAYGLAAWGIQDRPTINLLASAAIVVFAAVNVAGNAHASRVQGGITIIKIVMMVAFVVAGLAAAGTSRFAAIDDWPRPADGLAPLGGALAALVYVSYAYTGWNAASYLAGEIRDPGRSLPRAILGGTVVVVLLYIGMNLVYALALPVNSVLEIARLHGRDAVAPIAELAAAELFAAAWRGRISAATAVMLLGALSALILTGPRVAVAMAESGQIPQVIGRYSRRSGAPVVATAGLAAASLVLLWSGSFEFLVVFSGVGLAGFSLATVAAVFVLRIRLPNRARPFRVPGFPFVPAFYLVATTALVVASTIEQPLPSIIAALVILAGWPLGWLNARQR